jgi:uncharacterized protein YjbJ (UPF0337 family)
MESTMDRERLRAATEKAKGAVKETAGKVMGDEKLQAKGKADKVKGAAHKVAGNLKEAARHSSEEMEEYEDE